MFNGNSLSGNFIAAVNGIVLDDGSASRHAQWNKWYSHLGLSQEECEAIALQLSKFGSIFTAFSNANSYSVVKYGLDSR